MIPLSLCLIECIPIGDLMLDKVKKKGRQSSSLACPILFLMLIIVIS